MATITKHRARKLSAAGPPSLGWADLSFPGLLQRKHVSITVGDHVIRIEADVAAKLAGDILNLLLEHSDK